MTDYPVRQMHPILFNRVMRLPRSLRSEVLEYAGAASLADGQIKSLLDDICALIEKEGQTGTGTCLTGRLHAA
ncbi:hypothetical protein M2324_001587 [Rhodovulum sulfidophilum]|uniref:hypothetical protein n=1 Tax=Rhodovulum sulfidophilum TaxID=35806 RepID=UPI0018C86ED5|nr:hypothetical protein [Rhodovulum sulfidophilum]MCW2303194.1 hypothetical protein [Rhodovulum sulfidophilum]